MATLTTALATSFTPAAGDFIVQCSAGVASLQRRASAGAGWTHVGTLTGNDSARSTSASFTTAASGGAAAGSLTGGKAMRSAMRSVMYPAMNKG